MTEKILFPRFLTMDVAEVAVATVVEAVIASRRVGPLLKRHMFHIVILVPVRIEQAIGSSMNFKVEPHVLYEYSHGNPSEWPHEFDGIARSKAKQRWYGINDDRTNVMPHLLAKGDTPFWGTAEYQRVVTACSGVQPWLDKMIAGMVTHMCVGLAYENWMTGQDKQQEVSFIS